MRISTTISDEIPKKIKLTKERVIHVQNYFDRKDIKLYRETENYHIRQYVYNKILRKYYSLVAKEVSNIRVSGYEFEDLMQEAAIVAFEVIHKDYKLEFNNPFWYFLRMCTRRRLYSLVKSSNTRKNSIFNKAFRFDNFVNDESNKLQENRIMPRVYSHENSVIEKIYTKLIIQKLKAELSEVEYITYFERNVNELSYRQISEKYGFHAKKIDNAIGRASKKLKKIMAVIEKEQKNVS